MIRNNVTMNSQKRIFNNASIVGVSMKQDSITVGCTTVDIDVIKFLLATHEEHFTERPREVVIQTPPAVIMK